MEKKYTPCGGCGAEIPSERCIGCFHSFSDDNKYPTDNYPQTPEMDLILRIVKQWGNVVEMPNMEGWLKEYAAKQAPQGKVWVKTSERLPGYTTPVKWRDCNDHSHATDGKIPLIDMAKPFLVNWEWLDESATGSAKDTAEDPLLQRIKDFKLSDISAPIFTHTREFETHFLYIKGKLMEILNQNP